MRSCKVDVAGLGLNATDTVLLVREFPPLGGKEKAVAISRHAGGQVATALVCCQRLGLRTRYIGKVGDDEGGKIQLDSLRKEGVEIRHVRTARDTPNQLGLIVVDHATGERTVFWDRDPRLAVRRTELVMSSISNSGLLLIDGCDVEACFTAAGWARQAGIPVVADFDTVYEDVEKLFPLTDYLIASHNFLPAVTGQSDPFRALEYMAGKFQVPVPGMTLGRDGALALKKRKFYYSPGFVVETVDTTGAGDVFHGAFIFGILKRWLLCQTLEFANAMAALNCTRLGARGGIATAQEAEALMASVPRHRNAQYGKVTGNRRRSSTSTKPPAAR